MAAAARRKAAATSPRFVPKRGQVLKRVFESLFAWLPRRRLLFRKNRAPRGRRGNRVPAGGGHVEPEPDVATAAASPPRRDVGTATNYPHAHDATY